MGIGKSDDLTSVGRVGENFLVTAHGGIEYHFSDGTAVGTDCLAAKNAAIFKCENRWAEQINLPARQSDARPKKSEMGNLISLFLMSESWTVARRAR